jgi:hypothetical protein
MKESSHYCIAIIIKLPYCNLICVWPVFPRRTRLWRTTGSCEIYRHLVFFPDERFGPDHRGLVYVGHGHGTGTSSICQGSQQSSLSTTLQELTERTSINYVGDELESGRVTGVEQLELERTVHRFFRIIIRPTKPVS